MTEAEAHKDIFERGRQAGVRERLEKPLLQLISEVEWLLKGGDDPHDRCTECGLPGVGMLRDALKDAKSALMAEDAALTHQQGQGGRREVSDGPGAGQ